MDDESNEMVYGHWHRLGHRTRCDYCWRVTDYLYVVSQGLTTGKFCSKDHFYAAYNKMHKKTKIDE